MTTTHAAQPESTTKTTYEVFVRRADGTVRSTLQYTDKRAAEDAAKRNLYLLRDHPDWQIVIGETVVVTTSTYSERVAGATMHLDDEQHQQTSTLGKRVTAGGTCLQGYIDISYAELVAKLGEPDSNGDGYKVDAEWAREIAGVIVTIYNYKDGPNYNDGAGSVRSIRNWHIGGFDKRAVDAVRALFPHHDVS